MFIKINFFFYRRAKKLKEEGEVLNNSFNIVKNRGNEENTEEFEEEEIDEMEIEEIKIEVIEEPPNNEVKAIPENNQENNVSNYENSSNNRIVISR